ncbi:MAG: RIP metalloprotease RseP [Proteobacteria bacterium]|nr:RIP metalloprotease RseP [Pseudomonadota bacterium]
MSTVFGSIGWLIVSIGILVTFHEYGHFLVARWFGVHVQRFSVGFGKPLLKHEGKDGTEYVVSLIPLGGYVKMLDEREYEVPAEDLHRAHNRKPVWQRMLIAAAGPAFNFLLAFVLFWGMFVIGLPDYQPLVGHVGGLAAEAGFQPGDRLLRIGSERVDTWTDAGLALATAAMDRQPVEVEVAREDGGHALRTLPLQRLPSGLDDAQAMTQMGLFPKQGELPAVVGQLSPGGAAAGVLRAGDRIVSVDGIPTPFFVDLLAAVHRQAHAGVPLRLVIDRNGQRLDVSIVPKPGDPGDGHSRLLIGIAAQPVTATFDGLRRYGPVDAIAASAREMRRQVIANATMLKRVFTEGATSGLHSVVTIATTADAAARNGVAWFLFFLALLSLGLGLINLLPIPILDGGHLLYYLIELVKGRPLSDRTLAVGQFVGLVLLGGLMCVAFYNDLLRPAP